MLCKTIPRRYTIYSSLAFVLSFFISFLFLFSNSYAVSDKVVTIDSSNYSNYVDICESDCSDYSILSVSVIYPESGFISSANNAIGFSFRFNTPYGIAGITESLHFGFINNVFYDFSSFRYFPTRIRYTQSFTPDNFYSSGGFVVFTLSESSGGGSCPECEICPVIPENPYDNKLDQLTRAVYVCAGTMLVLYFFYCLYRLIIKNSGVK